MNNDVKFLNIEWRTLYSLTNFLDHFGLHSYFLDPNIICVVSGTFVYVGLITNSSGQLTELIIYIIPLEYIW